MAAPVLTAEEAQLVKDSWEFGVLLNFEHHAMTLFLGIFERAPSVKSMFSFLQELPPDEPLDKNARLQKHANTALKAAGEAVAALGGTTEEVEKTMKKVRLLGRVHAKYNVVEAHFPVLKDALMDTLHKGFRSMWNDKLEAAWSKATDIVALEMIEGLKEGYAKREKVAA